MTVKHISCLLEFCLRSTYFTFQDKYYEQVEGAAMASPFSPIVANLYTEDFEMRAINISPHPPLMWKRFLDDTFAVIKAAHKQNFLDHLNSVDHHIQFTSEDPRPDRSIPFLDILDKIAALVQQSTGNLLIQTYICNGIAILPFNQNIV